MTRSFQDSTELVVDVLTNDDFQRSIDGNLVEVPDTMAVKYGNSINSVFYFALLPYGLNDAAVNKSYLGDVEIKGQSYHKIKVTFDQEGGGTDFQDVFIYWFNNETSHPDYLAYQYETNGGGMRFRQAYNERIVNGIRFVDYINYKPKVKGSVQLNAIDKAYTSDQLKELSRIELDDVQVKL